jgi:predicted transcriptional regulator
MTYVNAINFAIASLTGKPVEEAFAVPAVEKLVALGQQLEKRNSAKSGKPTKTQRENADVKGKIVECLTHTLQGMRCGDIANEVGISGQKCSALLSQLVKSGEVVKKEGEKRVSLFLLPENDLTDGEKGE